MTSYFQFNLPHGFDVYVRYIQAQFEWDETICISIPLPLLLKFGGCTKHKTNKNNSTLHYLNVEHPLLYPTFVVYDISIRFYTVIVLFLYQVQYNDCCFSSCFCFWFYCLCGGWDGGGWCLFVVAGVLRPVSCPPSACCDYYYYYYYYYFVVAVLFLSRLVVVALVVVVVVVHLSLLLCPSLLLQYAITPWRCLCCRRWIGSFFFFFFLLHLSRRATVLRVVLV